MRSKRNSIRTSHPIASKAGKTLSDKNSSKLEKTLAGTAIVNRKSSSTKKGRI